MKRFIWLAVLLLGSNSLAAGIITNGPRNAPRIALTFDSDMTPGMKRNFETKRVDSYNNTRIYDLLAKYNTPATFFLTGMWMELYPAQVREFMRRGYELENHSYSHPGFQQPCYGLASIPEAQKRDQIIRTQKLLESYGLMDHYFRFPRGCASSSDLHLVESLGLHVVHWDVIGGDGGATNPRIIENNVLSQVKNGSIIVLHNHGGPKVKYTAQALKVIIPALLKRGFQFVTVWHLLHSDQP